MMEYMSFYPGEKDERCDLHMNFNTVMIFLKLKEGYDRKRRENDDF